MDQKPNENHDNQTRAMITKLEPIIKQVQITKQEPITKQEQITK